MSYNRAPHPNVVLDKLKPLPNYTKARNLNSSNLIDGEKIYIAGYLYPWVVKTGNVTDNGWFLAFDDAPSTRYLESTADKFYGDIFGASPDLGVNVTDELDALSLHVEANNGGVVELAAGEYIVGKQTLSGAVGLGRAWIAQNIIKIEGCGQVTINLDGVKFKLDDGLRFGSFDPVTGEPHYPSLPFTDYDYRSDVGIVVNLVNNSSVVVNGSPEIDGGQNRVILGGQWGDTGYQCEGVGFRAYNNKKLIVNGIIEANDCCLDAVLIGWVGVTEADPIYPHVIGGIVGKRNARQGLSWVGGNHLVALSLSIMDTGKGAFGSAPGAGIDIEAESAICRNGHFFGAHCENNLGVGMVADSGDSANIHFYNPKFIGTTNYAIWPRKPGITFHRGTIVGAWVNAYTSTKPSEATKFLGTTFSDEVKYSANLWNADTPGQNLFGTSDMKNVLFQDVEIITTRFRPGRFDQARLNRVTIRHSAGTNAIVDQDYLAILWGAKITDLTIIDEITTNQPANAYYLAVNGNEIFRGDTFLDSTGLIKWDSWSGGAGGVTGQRGENYQKTVPASLLSVIAGSGNNRNIYGTCQITFGTAPPAAGTLGDLHFNSAPALGSVKFWQCTVSGNPATWESGGTL